MGSRSDKSQSGKAKLRSGSASAQPSSPREIPSTDCSISPAHDMKKIHRLVLHLLANSVDDIWSRSRPKENQTNVDEPRLHITLQNCSSPVASAQPSSPREIPSTGCSISPAHDLKKIHRLVLNLLANSVDNISRKFMQFRRWYS
jgi:hypothetical protein